jgi:hypothetical protein
MLDLHLVHILDIAPHLSSSHHQQQNTVRVVHVSVLSSTCINMGKLEAFLFDFRSRNDRTANIDKMIAGHPVVRNDRCGDDREL